MDAIERYLAENDLIECTRFSSRLTPESCDRFRTDNPSSCEGCLRNAVKIETQNKTRLANRRGGRRGGAARTAPTKREGGTMGNGGDQGRTVRVCSVDGCEKKHSAKGYCSTHYASIYQKQQQVCHPGSGQQKLDVPNIEPEDIGPAVMGKNQEEEGGRTLTDEKSQRMSEVVESLATGQALRCRVGVDLPRLQAFAEEQYDETTVTLAIEDRDKDMFEEIRQMADAERRGFDGQILYLLEIGFNVFKQNEERNQ